MAGLSARWPIRAIAVPLALLACARGPTLRDGVYRDTEHGFTIAAPSGAWRLVHAEGANLALRREDGSAMSVTSRCGVAPAPPEMLARQLRFELGPHRLVASVAGELAGAPSHIQRIELTERPLRVETRTRVAPPCVQDFVLVAPRDSRDAEAVFDAWCASFREAPR
jgi:hypothetical protein